MKRGTAAKLAGLGAFVHNGPVALWTTHTHRAGGLEPLRTPGREMGIPLRIVRNAAELHPQAHELGRGDLILVDTLRGAVVPRAA